MPRVHPCKWLMMAIFRSLLTGRAILSTMAAVTFLASVAPAAADKRVALVIGNGAYRNAPRLPNPTNDAQDVAAALKRSGFDTIVGLDLDRAGMDATAIRFARAARDADVALFYYSGHAMQYAGINYLVPVDARLTDEADLRLLARVDDIVADLQKAKNLRILVLDSCRDNPLADDLKRSIGASRGVSLQRGLAKIDSPEGLIVAFATQAGRTAEDGSGRNSPYTTAFLKHIETQEEIGTVFRKISADVYAATKQGQLPELSLSLIGEFYLRGRADIRLNIDPGNAAAPPPSEAAQAWAVTKDTTSPAVLQDFIRQFGTTPYGSMARARLEELKLAVANAPPPRSQKPSEALVPETVPFITDHDRAAIRSDYLAAPDHKALAISQSRIGFISGQRDDETAKTAAMATCQRASDAISPGRPCEVYAVGNAVVSTRGRPPMPPEPWVVHDRSIERPVASKDVPFVSENMREQIQKSYSTFRGRKALAISPRGYTSFYFGGSDEVIRRSLEWCGSNAGVPCMIVAVDDVFVVPIPTTTKVVGFFRAGSHGAIAPEARDDVARRLASATGGWSAVAVGASGRPGMALKAANEQDAIGGALSDCGRQDRDCRVIALGPFTVEPKADPK
jgi:Caspase domain